MSKIEFPYHTAITDNSNDNLLNAKIFLKTKKNKIKYK